ncbi:MAG: NAD(P)-dependent glycerol-3-phosphate dehydrogenase [Pseudomonadota bacterium]|nr:NAD(P)-dependent glycerol-3-phosphate dehydrogenase [Pseudomonadota bacterium]
MSSIATILILGAGNFGTCLACHLGNLGHAVLIWTRSQATVAAINEEHRNDRYLTDIQLPTNVRATSDISDALAASDILLLAVPTQALRSVLPQVRNHIKPDTLIVSTLKGVELDSGLLPQQIVADVLAAEHAQRMITLSGPSFAAEIAAKQPSCVSIAGRNPDDLNYVQEVFHSPKLRIYTSDDPIGLEVAGAYKNVIAIAAGASAGAGFGENSAASLITRGLAEMVRFGVACGADPMTFLGLGGVGDLFLTCSSKQSRNFRVGFGLGRGHSLADTLAGIDSVAEGVATSKSIYMLAQQRGISSPIAEAVYLVLHQGLPITQAIDDLLNREAKSELE